MDFILELVIEFVVVWIIGYPASFMRWAFTGFKKGRFKEFLKADAYINFGYFTLFLILTIVIIKLLQWAI
jgi:hypothetical protein